MNFKIFNKGFIFSIDALFVVISLIILIGAMYSFSSVDDYKISELNFIKNYTNSISSSAFYLGKNSSDYSASPYFISSIINPSSSKASVHCSFYVSVNSTYLGSSNFSQSRFCKVVE